MADGQREVLPASRLQQDDAQHPTQGLQRLLMNVDEVVVLYSWNIVAGR